MLQKIKSVLFLPRARAPRTQELLEQRELDTRRRTLESRATSVGQCLEPVGSDGVSPTFRRADDVETVILLETSEGHGVLNAELYDPHR